MNITKAVSHSGFAIDPYKYYAWEGEVIYKISCDNNVSFMHLDSDGDVIFNSNNSCSKETIVANSSSENHDFETYFNEIISEDIQDLCFDDHADFLRTLTRKSPIIIGGCGRSGTTLLLSILGGHSNIHAFEGESYSFYPYPYRLNIIRKLLQKSGVKFLERWCEKTPKNVLAFRDIYNLFNKHVKLIHIVRDGRDVVTSYHPNHEYKKYWVDVDRWVMDTKAGLDCEDIVYTIKYEDLVVNPKEALLSLCEYIDEPFEESLLEYHKTTSVKNDAGWVGSARPISSIHTGRWKDDKYSDRIEEFTNNKDAMRLMDRLEYV